MIRSFAVALGIATRPPRSSSFDALGKAAVICSPLCMLGFSDKGALMKTAALQDRRDDTK